MFSSELHCMTLLQPLQTLTSGTTTTAATTTTIIMGWRRSNRTHWNVAKNDAVPGRRHYNAMMKVNAHIVKETQRRRLTLTEEDWFWTTTFESPVLFLRSSRPTTCRRIDEVSCGIRDELTGVDVVEDSAVDLVRTVLASHWSAASFTSATHAMISNAVALDHHTHLYNSSINDVNTAVL